MIMKFTDVLGKNFALKNTIKKINGVEVEIKGYLDIVTFTNIIHLIADGCFEEGKYFAENREIMRRYAILKYMTNIDVTQGELNEVFKASQSGNWFAEIEKEVVKLPIWAEVESAIDAQIASQPSAFDNLCSNLAETIKIDPSVSLTDIKEVLDGLNKVNQKDFVEAAIENNLTKNKGGDENGGEKS